MIFDVGTNYRRRFDVVSPLILRFVSIVTNITVFYQKISPRIFLLLLLLFTQDSLFSA